MTADEAESHKTIDLDLYNRFDGFSRNRKFFRDWKIDKSSVV